MSEYTNDCARRLSGFPVFSGPASEECNPLNMSIEAEMVIEQMKEQHHRDLCHLRLELEDKVSPASSLTWSPLSPEHPCCFFLTEQLFLCSQRFWGSEVARSPLPQTEVEICFAPVSPDCDVCLVLIL